LDEHVGVVTGPAKENAGTPTGGPGGHAPAPPGTKFTDTLAAVAHGVVGQLGHAAVSVNSSVTVPPGKPTKPMPVGADLARLNDFRQAVGLKMHAGPLLPAQASVAVGVETVTTQ
jgi:hypothetical protein